LHRIRVCSEQRHQPVVVTHATAAGEAILAHLPADRVEETFDHHGLDPLTAGTTADRERLGEQLRPVRDDGPEDELSGRYFREGVAGQVISTARRVEIDLRTGDLRSERSNDRRTT